jgi:F-type H+-transporting ATPase subunit delta
VAAVAGSLAARYAEALWRAAAAQQREEAVAEELRWLGVVLERASEFVPLVADPRMATERQTALVDRLVGGQIGDLVRGLLHLLIRKRRFTALPGIIAAFDRAYHRHRGLARARIAVARALEPSLVERIRRQVERATGKRLDAEVAVDPSLIGGVAVRVDDGLFDDSVRQRLALLRQQLRHVRVA